MTEGAGPRQGSLRELAGERLRESSGVQRLHELARADGATHLLLDPLELLEKLSVLVPAPRAHQSPAALRMVRL